MVSSKLGFSESSYGWELHPQAFIPTYITISPRLRTGLVGIFVFSRDSSNVLEHASCKPPPAGWSWSAADLNRPINLPNACVDHN